MSLCLEEPLRRQVRFLVEPRTSEPPPPDSWVELAGLARRLDLEVALRGRDRDAPESVRRRVETRYREVQAGNLLRLRAFRGIAVELERAGIPFLPLKGLDLLETVWSDPGLRPMRDLDLLVPPGRREAAGEALRGCGHEWVGEGPGQDAYRGETLVVEIHDVVLPPPLPGRLDEEAVWERSSAPLGAPGRRLSAEDRILYLLGHLYLGEIHRHRTPLLLRDLAALLERGPVLDWDALRRRSEDASLCPFVTRGLAMLREVLGEGHAGVPAIPEAPVGRRGAWGFRLHAAAVREALSSGEEGVGQGVGRGTLLSCWLPAPRAAALLVRRGLRPARGRLGRIARLLREARRGASRKSRG